MLMVRLDLTKPALLPDSDEEPDEDEIMRQIRLEEEKEMKQINVLRFKAKLQKNAKRDMEP